MLILTNSNKGKTAVRHGDKDGYVDYLIEKGFDPKVTEVTRTELTKVGKDDRHYGFLTADLRILLIDTIGIKGQKSITRYWEIMI